MLTQEVGATLEWTLIRGNKGLEKIATKGELQSQRPTCACAENILFSGIQIDRTLKVQSLKGIILLK